MANVLHDFQCSKCSEIEIDLPLRFEGSKCRCGGTFDIFWGHVQPRNAAALDTKEMTVVYENPQTGQISYPGRNDRPMPERLRQRGYVRRELRSLREVERFSEKHGVVNEAAHYDRGSGRGYEDGKR